MSADSVIVAPKAALNFSGIMGGLQVVRNGDDREKNQDEHGQSDELDVTSEASVWSAAQPMPEEHNCKQTPAEIES